MTIRASFQTADGRVVPFPAEAELTPEQGAFILLTVAVGMDRLNEYTMDEFVRRAELFQTHIAHCLHDEKGPVLVGRAILEEMLGDHQLASTNTTSISRAKFDAMIAKEKAAAKAASR